MPSMDIQLDLLDLGLVPNAWIGIDIETLGCTPPPCFFWMKILQAVLQSLCQSTLQPTLLLLPVWVSLCFLIVKSHTLCTSVSSVFFQLHLYHYEVVRSACTAAQTPGPIAKVPALWGHPESHEVLNPYSPISSLINSILVRRPCIFAHHELDLAICRQLINVYWNDLIINDISTFTLGMAL